MAVTNYYSIHGVITGEEVVGGSRLDYLTDGLGSVVATVDQSAQVVNTYRYKPFGALLAKTGGGSDPAFQWVGSQGYRQTGKSYSDVYIRARHYSSALGRWTTKDPMVSIITGNLYAYADSRPTAASDPSGLQPCLPCPQGLCSTYLRNNPTTSIINRNSIKACVETLDERRAIYEGIKNVWCQAGAFCGKPRPSWCNPYIIPPSRYSDPNEPGVIYATTACCDDGTGNCRGMLLAGPGWRQIKSHCFKACVVEHEYTHKRDCENTFGRGPNINPRSYNPKYWNWSECRGWCNTLSCLLSLAERFSIRPPREVPPEDISWRGPIKTCGGGFSKPNPITGRPVVPMP